ncbi:MAG: hypothetical protein HQL58_07230 [Magnetococcales bacterium]|nr:hypothetical protein [Magnetococcales bacterium]
MSDITNAFRERFQGLYIYFHDGLFSRFSMTSRALAQGFQALGIPVYSNIDAPPLLRWQSIYEPQPLVYLFEVNDNTYSPAYMRTIQVYQGAVKLILCMSDNLQSYITPEEIPALMAHENRFINISGWRVPWAFGLSQQTIEATAGGLPFGQRRPVVLHNFRPSFNQGIRHVLDLALLPWLEQWLTVDRRLSDDDQQAVRYQDGQGDDEHGLRYQDHFDKLKQYQACLAYGGHFFPNLARSNCFKDYGPFKHYTFLQDPVVLRWDSFRFWESLAAGCLTLHLDFDRYGFLLPQMPVAWQHYLPVDLSDPKGSVAAIIDQQHRLADIAAAGQQWALTHYRPQAVAQRLIDLVMTQCLCK